MHCNNFYHYSFITSSFGTGIKYFIQSISIYKINTQKVIGLTNIFDSEPDINRIVFIKTRSPY